MNKKGEITVEAAFIIPVILLIVFLFVYVIFAVHDRVVLFMKADLLLETETAPFLAESGTDIDMQEGLFIYKINSFEINRNNYFFTVNVDAKARMSLGYLIPFFERFEYFGVHKMHRVHDYCREKRVMSVVRKE